MFGNCPMFISRMMRRIGILWFRNDLRLADNASLNRSLDLITNKQIDYLLPFYCFDEAILEEVSREAKLSRCSGFRRNFMIESVRDLRESLRNKLGSTLYIAYGAPEIKLAEFIDTLLVDNKDSQVVQVLASRDVAHEEIELEKRAEKLLNERKIRLELIWDNTMIHVDDLPYKAHQMPDTFTSFKKSIETRQGDFIVRKPFVLSNDKRLPKIDSAIVLSEDRWGEENIPKKKDIVMPNNSAIYKMFGGETAAFDRMLNYFFKTNGLNTYKETRNGLVGTEYSSKFSLWLALGCISPRLLYYKVKEFESQRRPNESTKHFIYELLWRDFFKFHALKFDKKIFYLNGLWSSSKASSSSSAAGYTWKKDMVLFEKWCKGETGYPFVDANMKELNETGWMSNRGRQNVASFLTKDLEIDWRFGAEYFEATLIDYDVTSNWCNWQYVAGVGVDPRKDRYFNTTKQAYDYDSQGDFARLWLPQLAKVPREFVYCPWRLSLVEQKRFECILGKDYPAPCVKAKFDWNPNQKSRPRKF